MKVLEKLLKIPDQLTGHMVTSTMPSGKAYRFVNSVGVPQGSVPGPLLWHVMYDEVLRLSFEKGLEVIEFANDLTVIVCYKPLEEAKNKLSQIQ